jgi:hypothetical protein
VLRCHQLPRRRLACTLARGSQQEILSAQEILRDIAHSTSNYGRRIQTPTKARRLRHSYLQLLWDSLRRDERRD